MKIEIVASEDLEAIRKEPKEIRGRVPLVMDARHAGLLVIEDED